MIFHPAQSKVASSPKRFRVVCAGRRGGKTELAVYEMIGKAYAKKGRNITYVAPTFQQARDIAWVKLVEACKAITVKVNETRLEITVQTMDKGKSIISLHGWESIESLRGQAFDFIVIDEIASMRNWETLWMTVIRPTLTDREGEVLFISTPKGFNHFYDLYNLCNDPVKGKDYASFHFTSYDNPYISKEEIDKARSELSEDQFAHWSTRTSTGNCICMRERYRVVSSFAWPAWISDSRTRLRLWRCARTATRTIGWRARCIRRG
jgi:hypothetical protein